MSITIFHILLTFMCGKFARIIVGKKKKEKKKKRVCKDYMSITIFDVLLTFMCGLTGEAGAFS